MRLNKSGNSKIGFILMCIILLTGVGLVGTSAGDDTATQKSGDTGVVGGLFHFVGDVIAFPFRVVGHTIDAIF